MIKNHSLKWKRGFWVGLLGEGAYYQVWQSECNIHGTHIGRKDVSHQSWLYTYVCLWLWHMSTHTGVCTDKLTKTCTDKWVKWKYNYKNKEKKAMVNGYILGFPILGLSPKNLIFHLIDTYSAMSIGSLFTIVRKWKQHKCTSTDKQMMKMLYIYTVGYYLYVK